MRNNPDVYLLYEYMDKLPFVVRIKVQLDEPVDVQILTEAAQRAISRYPYFSVSVGLDEGQNYILKHNDRPLAVLPEEDKRMVLGSEEVNGHLFAITYRDDSIYFNFSHAPCGATGGLFWVKTTLYEYMTEKYGEVKAPADLKAVGSPVTEGELAFPDADSLPTDEPMVRYTGGDSRLALMRTLNYLLNPFIKNNYYYQIEIPTDSFMEYARSIDASPNTILVAMMARVICKMYEKKKADHLSIRVAADYRSDIGADLSYRDFVRFIHVRYEWNTLTEPIQKLNMRARGALITQNQPELSCERFRKMQKAHDGIDAQPDLKTKKKFAGQNSAFRSDPMDNCTISYVGKIDWGGMEAHIKNVFTITDGDLMLEVNALQDHFCITYQLFGKDRTPLDIFCSVLDEEKVSYKVSERFTRYIPKISLPKA